MLHSKLLSLVFTAVLASPSYGAITSFINDKSVYDYVIVGAGTAGLVLANRLSANPYVTVLVIEAGVSDDGVVPVQAPFLGPTITPNTPWDWNYTTVAQSGLDGRSFNYPRGKLLGGSSSANYLFHQFGSSEDWTRLATVTGDSLWKWSNMRKYVQVHERVTAPIDGHDTTTEIIPAYHGYNGILPTSLHGYNQTIDPRVLLTTQQLSSDFPWNKDMSGGDNSLLGFGAVKSAAGGGKRSSSSTTYLAAAKSRPNLTVLINATVLKLIQTGTATVDGVANLPLFNSVTFTATPGTFSTVSARKEVILSAGSVGTPQILQLSGIGDANLLKSFNIVPVINNPSVGANMSDHSLTPNLFTVKGDLSFDGVLRDPVQVQATLNQYVSSKTGMFANNIANHFGFKRLPWNSAILSSYGDPTPGPGSPHWEMVPANLFFAPGFPSPSSGSYMTVVLILLSPTSRGYVKIKSANPLVAPLINPNFLTTNVDIETLREGVRSVIKFIGAAAWSDYVTGRYGQKFIAAVDNASIDAYVRSITTTIFHPASTAMMTKKTDTWGVVNPDFRVKGTAGLRVVDSSVFPYQLSCHPQGPIYLLAERASDIIRGS